MKHSLPVTLTLVGLFLAAQLVGLALLLADADLAPTPTGEINLTHPETSIGPRPEFEGLSSLLYIVIGVAIGTSLLLLLVRLKGVRLWRLWFWAAVLLTVAIALGVIMPSLAAWAVAALLATWKVLRPNAIVHNLSEVLMYSGLAILFVPLFTPAWMALLLIIVSVYDAVAVWWSKHMVSLATFQARSQLFAGLVVPTSRAKGRIDIGQPDARRPRRSSKRPSHAILGGGDLAFPLLFAGVTLEWLIRSGTAPPVAFALSLLVSLGAGVALFILFLIAKSGRFYPAMPAVTAGCFAGFSLAWLLSQL